MSSKTNQKDKWYVAGLHFECSQCGNCCSGVPGYVWVAPEESHKIAEYLKMSPDEFSKKYLRLVQRRISLIELPDYDCVFLERTPQGIGCKIYPVRPQQCRTWPFWKMNLRSSSAYLNNTKRCPGINRGDNHTFEQIEAIVDSSPC